MTTKPRTKRALGGALAGPANALQRDFPFEELHPVAELESWRKEIARPIYHVHKWWAQRLGSVFRAMILAGSLPPDADVWAQFYGPKKDLRQIVLDPFMGSGTTLGEALKLGCKVVGCDINPVSYFAVKKALSFVPEERLRAAYARLEAKVAPKVRALYSAKYEGKPAEILYTFWVMEVPCKHCRKNVPLFSKWIFSSHAYPKKHPESLALCPACGDLNEVDHSAEAHACVGCKHRFNPQKGPAQGQTATCPGCSGSFKIVEAVRSVKTPPSYRMYALMLLTDEHRKVYQRATAEDLRGFARATKELRNLPGAYPEVEIPEGINTNQARGYNFKFWHQMFNARQLLAHGTILAGIMEEADAEAREQLLLLFSGMLEFNNMFCSFKGEGTGAVRHLFSHHILKPERTALEANPWGTDRSSGGLSMMFERRLIAAKRYAADPSEIRPTWNEDKLKGEKVFGINHPVAPRIAENFDDLLGGTADALLCCGDSGRLPVPDKSVDLVITDPPYFDNVHYSELADFFFCWLAKGLGDSEPAFAGSTTRSTGEVQAADCDEFSSALGRVFSECSRVLKPEGTLAFTFHHSRTEAWIAVATALRMAGLEVIATHPVKAEMSVAVPKQQAKEPINLDLILVCRHARGICDDRDLDAVAMRQIQRLRSSGMKLSRGDIRVVVMGTVLRRLTSATDNESVMASLFVESDPRIEALFLAQGEFRLGSKQPQLNLFDSPTA